MANKVNKTEKPRKQVNYAQVFAIQGENEKRILKLCPTMPRKSGIYMFYRERKEEGKPDKCIYIGQSRDCLYRCGQHLGVVNKTTHIDKSLYAHKLYSADNPEGWKVCLVELCPIAELDAKEQKYIDHYKDREDIELYNVTGGGQFNKKGDIGERVQPNLKRYKSGKEFMYQKVKEQVKNYFTKYLDYSIKPPTTKIKERKLQEFKQFLEGNDEGGND